MRQNLAILMAIFLPVSSLSRADTPPSQSFTPDQINSLVAPIALYPDELISQMLVASTYPLEIVQAYQWMQQHPELKGKDLVDAAQKQSWDPSVQALVAFPDVLKRMNQDVTWTTNLGNAFLASQSNVMDAIQKMRTRAQDAGKLNSTEQQQVTDKTENGQKVIVIEPTHPDVVYVPDYDPVWIWGPAPVWYPYPYWYYPPPPPYGYWCWWGPRVVVSSVFIGWGGWVGWGWHPYWYGRNIVVNRTFITVNRFNTVQVNSFRGHEVWVHEPVHRMGVSYPSRALSDHFRPMGRSEMSRVTVPQAREQFRAAGMRMQADRFGSRQISPSVFNRNRTAFGGMERGPNARMHSDRGYSSLGRVSAPAQSVPGGRQMSGSSPSGRRWGKEEGDGRGGGSWGGGNDRFQPRRLLAAGPTFQVSIN